MSKKRKKGMNSNAKWGIALVAEIIVLIIMAVCYGNLWIKSKIAEVNIQEIEEEDIVVNEGINEDQESYTNIALFGLDARDMGSGALQAGNRSDSIMIASINNETKEVRIVSLYRDSFLEIEDEDGSWLTKVNAAYAYGGPELAINTINANLDLHITDYVAVNFQALSEAIDVLGGIPIHLDSNELPMLNAAITEQISITGKNVDGIFEPGDYILNGTQATAYARIRSTDQGDITRTERQREVIFKVMEKAKSSNLGTINDALDAALPYVLTSFSEDELYDMVTDVLDYEISQTAGFPFAYYPYSHPTSGSILVPADLSSNVTALHEFLFGTQSYVPSQKVQDISSSVQYETGVGAQEIDITPYLPE